jgi:uncharacterized protein (DUF433 family)
MAVHYDIGSMITSTPTINGGRPRIARTGTSVRRISVYDIHGYSHAEIVADRPYLTLAQVHAALAYYRANKAKVDADLAADEAFEEEYLSSHPQHS